MRRLAVSISALAMLSAAVLTAQPASASVTHVSGGSITATRPALGVVMLSWAETQRGKPYVWGGTGPAGYDCSGLVVAAARRSHVALPRTTYAMIFSRHLARTYWPRRGDLAFWGPISAPFHVEFVTGRRGVGFGALDSGTPVGWDDWGWGWLPSAYYRVIR